MRSCLCEVNKMEKENIPVGTRIHEMTILSDDGYINGRRKVTCRCSCGNVKQITYYDLKKGHTKSCGRCNYQEIHIGDRFGEWEVLDINEHAPRGTRRYATCKCSCGNIKKVACYKLTSGKSLSCGCWRSGAKNYPKRLHYLWNGMMGRCYNPNNHKYQDYGARGIKVCDEWHNFRNYAEWALANGYSEDAKYGECTIDRIDVNGDYCPENCRWVNLYIQGNNKRNNVRLEYNGEGHTISEWSEITGIPRYTIENRYRRGYPIEDIFFCGDFDSHRRRKL